MAKAIEMPRTPDWQDPFVKEASKYNVGEVALMKRAEMLCDMQRFADAIKLLQDLVREYPSAKGSWTLMGWAQRQQGQFADAEGSLRTALVIDPDAALPLLYMGLIRVALKDRTGAKDYFGRAIDKKPDLFEAYLNMGLCLKEEGNRAGAIEKLHKAVQCQPFSARAHALLGQLLLEDHREDDAAFHLQEAIALNPDLQDARTRLEDLRRKQAALKKSS